MFILLHQSKKFFKRLHPLWFHLSCIKSFSIGLQPIQHIVLLYPVLRWIPMIDLNKTNHLFILNLPSFLLRHALFDYLTIANTQTYISSIDSPLYEMSYFLNSCVACSITSARCFSTPMLISSACRLIS